MANDVSSREGTDVYIYLAFVSLTMKMNLVCSSSAYMCMYLTR